MATLQPSLPRAGARPDPELFDTWTRYGIYIALIPLLGWDAASVFMLAVASKIDAWVAWIPAISTSGIMLASTRISMRPGLDPHVRAQARRLAWFGGVLGLVIAAVQHALPADIDTPHWGWRALIGGLPVAMGGALAHIYAQARASHDAALRTYTEAQAAEAAAVLAAETAQILARQTREAELAHADQLAQIETRATRERLAAELEAQRELAALAARTATVASAVKSPPDLRAVPPPEPSGNVDALGRKARPSEKRDAALRYLLAEHRDGRDLDTVTAAEVDRAIKANGYAKKNLAQWIADVRSYAQGSAA
jgi:hypothetical protein